MKKQMKQICGIGMCAWLALSSAACGSASAAVTGQSENAAEHTEEATETDTGRNTEENTERNTEEYTEENTEQYGEEPAESESMPEKEDAYGNHTGRRNGGPGGGFRGGKTENDAQTQAVLDENAGKFTQLSYEDEETGITLEYSFYIPENYDEAVQYPLLMYIPDSSGSGKSAKELVEQYYGAVVWVTDEEQQKHPSFIVVPAFSETVVDDNWNVSEQVEAAVHLLTAIQSQYSIDANRIYTTGQSMGCMTSLYLNSIYPNLFAASMYVSGQWDISVLKGMENQKFFYITAGGDAKASGGQDEVMEMFDADGVPYSYGTWNAQNSEEEQAEAVAELLSAGLNANMIRFETGSVIKEGENNMEHMASFQYGYKLSAVRDWLFEQTRSDC